ncbi:hypothetical protein BGZ68_009656 [Mortierella alpina]|nr:hypothetical protein BGZ68_009656 [Mortierella alpina]
MQSASHQIPRCVLAQSFLDNLSQSTSSSDHITDCEGQDKNTDLDAPYQELVHANGLQGARRSLKTTADLNSAFQHDNVEGTHHLPGIISNRQYARAEDDTLREERHHHRYDHRELLQHLQCQPVHFQQQQQYESGADQYLSSPEYPHQQPQPGYQRQTHHQHSPSSIDSGAYHHQHDQRQQQRQQQIHAERRHLESMFPPLHDSPLEETEHRTDPTSSIIHTSVEQMLQKPLASRTRQIHLLPPPIVIPKESPQHLNSNNKQPHQQQQRIAHQKTPLNPLPSPPSSNSSPDSPSSLAIHLYVHHHHHHHSQGTSSPASLNASSKSSDLATPSAPNLPSPPTPAVGSTPLPLEEQDPEYHSETHTNITSLPSPISPSADVIPSTAPLVAPRPLAPLLPSLAIPTSPSSISPPTPDENETSSKIPWFNHPQSLANASSNTSLSHQQQPSVPADPLQQEQAHVQVQPPRRHRHYRPQLPDPTLSQQLLSTISSKDLARLYVHAAHHLHSHQPIRHYVLMKMLMTQAELSQFGRLRADMPRAPGPSTGAKPRQRIGFGSLANTGLGARPKVPSKLGLYVSTMDYCNDADNDDLSSRQTRHQQQRRHYNHHPHPLSLSPLSKKKKSNSNHNNQCNGQPKSKKRTSVPWTQSLSSLVSLSSSALTQVSRKRPLSLTLTLKTLQLPQQIPKKSHSWYGTSPSRRFEEMELGEPLEEQDVDMEDEEDGREEEEDDFEGCEDQELEEEEEEEDEGEEEDEEDYWTAMRRTNNRSQRGLTRSTSSVELRQQQQQQHNLEHLASTARALSYKQQHAIEKHGGDLYYHQQQLQQQQQQQQHHKRLLYPLAIPLQPLPPHQQSLYPSPNSTGNIHSLVMGKSKNARRRAGVPSSTATMSSLPSSPVQRRSSSTSASSSSTMPASSQSSWSSTWPFFAPESFGFSGLLMLSLFFCVLYLFEGSAHYYNLQSALLSIIL